MLELGDIGGCGEKLFTSLSWVNNFQVTVKL